jgi:hypothetical protein
MLVGTGEGGRLLEGSLKLRQVGGAAGADDSDLEFLGSIVLLDLLCGWEERGRRNEDRFHLIENSI